MRIIAPYLCGWEWNNMIFPVTIWMGKGERDVLGKGLDGKGIAI